MRVSGTSTLAADRAAVWRALTDPAVLVRTIPGCRQLEALGEDTYRMTVSAGVGSVQGVYDGEVRLSDQQEPGAFRLNARGAGAPGTIGADVWVTLVEAPDGTTQLSYDAEAVVGGMIGGVGQRMLTGASKKMAEEFFRNVDALLLSGATAVDGHGAGAATEPSGGEPAGTGAAPAPGAARPAAGTVFTAPAAPRPAGPGFAAGVAVGAAAALVGALVGAWIAGRRR